MNALDTIPQDSIIFHNNQVRTTSLKVSEAFGKRHSNVLRSIQSLDCSSEFTQLNFELSEYVDNTGRKLPFWEMTKDGFMFLVMGFTGKEAARVKEAFINAFNAMADQLAKTENRGASLSEPLNLNKALIDHMIQPSIVYDKEIYDAINEKTFSLATEACFIIREHLTRRVASQCERGVPRQVNVIEALQVIGEGDLAFALTSEYQQRLGFVKNTAWMAKSMAEDFYKIMAENFAAAKPLIVGR